MKRFICHITVFIAIIVATLILMGIYIPYPENGYERAQFVKIGMLSKADRTPSMVLLGGSNVAFGFHSEMIEEAMGISVINAGLHAGIGLKMIVDDCARYLQKGDILVLSPEMDHFFGRTAYGEHALAFLYFLDPANYTPLLNLQQWLTVLKNSINYIVHNRLALMTNSDNKEQTDVYHASSFNQYGDVVWHWNHPSQNKYQSTRKEQKELSSVNQDYFNYLVNQLQNLESKGVRIIMYPPAMSNSCYENNRLAINWIERAFAKKGYPFICPHTRTVYPDSLMYDNDYHCQKEGAERHTQTLILILSQEWAQ